MAQLFANNASGKLLNAITTASTSLLLQAGQGEKFPVAVWPNYFKVTLEDAAKNVEVVRVTRAAGSDTLVVVDAAGANNTGGRGLEGTTARAFAAADVVELRLTAEALNDFSNKVSRAGDSMSGPLTLSGDATQPLHAVTKQQVDAAVQQVDAAKASKAANETISGAWTFVANPIIESNTPLISFRDTGLAVNANGLWRLAIYDGTFWLIKNTSAAGDFSVATTPLQVDANGNLTALGNVTAYSDRRFKRNIRLLDHALELTCRLRGVRFERTDTGEQGVGLVAQEVARVMPEVVVKNRAGRKTLLSLAYGNLVGLLVEAVKALKREKDADVKALRAELRALRAELARLKKRVG